MLPEPNFPVSPQEFIGRKAHLDAFTEALQYSTLTGRMASFAVLGDWGIGKSSLLFKLAASCTDSRKDIPGQDRRMHVRERICPISGPGLLSKSERKRKAREIIQASGADSPEYFNQVVKQDTGVTFREQSEIWLNQLQTRKRKPIGQSYAASIQAALDKWILEFVKGAVESLVGPNGEPVHQRK